MPRVLVTTAHGNVGREVVRQCRARGLQVRAAQTRALPSGPQDGAEECVRFDFLDRSTWPAALDGCDALFLVRPPPLGNMAETLCPFVDAAYARGVRQIVFLSVAGAERMKWVPHRQVELHLEQTGRAWTILRPGFFAQNLKDAYRQDIAEDDRIYVPAGRGRVAFVDAADIGAVAAHVLAKGHEFFGRSLTLTGAESLDFEQVAALLSGALGRTIRYEPASIAGYAFHLRTRRGMPWMQVAVQTILHVGLRRGDAEQIDPTVERLLARPPRRLAEFIREHAALWQPQGRTSRAHRA